MTTCTFVGSEVYDLDLYERLQGAVEEAVREAEEVEFLFYRRGAAFSHLCYMAALRAKRLYPRKKISLTLLVRAGEAKTEDLYGWMWRELPCWAFDRVAPVRMEPGEAERSACPWKRIERWMVRRSDVVIGSCYAGLRDGGYELLRYAAHRRNVRTVNLACGETESFIREAVQKLPPAERSIVEQIDAGRTFRAIAQEAGVSPAAIHVKADRGRRRLRKMAGERLKRMRGKRKADVPAVCGVLLPDGVMGGERFRQMAEILAVDLDVRAFMTLRGSCAPERMFSRFHGRALEWTVVTHDPELAREAEDARAGQSALSPVRYLYVEAEGKPAWARTLRAVRAVLERCDYLICDMRALPGVRVRRSVEGQRGVTVIDLGNAPRVLEPRAMDAWE